MKGGNEIKIGEREKSSRSSYLKGWQQQLWGAIDELMGLSLCRSLLPSFRLHHGPLDTTNARSHQPSTVLGDPFVPLFSGFSIGHQKDDDVRFSIFLCSTPRHTHTHTQRESERFCSFFLPEMCWWPANQRRPKCHQQLIPLLLAVADVYSARTVSLLL